MLCVYSVWSDNTFAWVFFDGSAVGDTITLNSLISTVSETTPSATTLATWVGVNGAVVHKWAGITDDNILDANKEAVGATLALRPNFITAGVINLENGKPAIAFTSAVEYLDTAIANTDMNSGSAFTLLSVSTNTVATSNATLVNTTSASADRFKLINDRSSSMLLCVVVPTGEASVTVNTLLQQNTSNQKIVSVIVDTNNVEGFYNSATQEDETYVGNYVNEVFRIGAQHGGATPLEGTIQEITLFPSNKTSEIADLQTDANTKYLP